jgi:23S rRNA (guanosine2251-2'-O)-methyltransferase
VWATANAVRAEPWLAGLRVEVVGADEVAARAGSDGHQGLCAEVEPYPYAQPDVILRGDSPLVVALDEVTDVQNAGAIARTAEVAGATGLVLPERRSAEVTPAMAKASAGAVEHLAIARVRNLADWLGDAQHAGAWVYGAAMDGAVPWTDVDWRGAVVLVMGAEGRGLRPRVAATCDQLVRLPQHGRLDSLNVSAAAAALLYEAVRVRA